MEIINYYAVDSVRSGEGIVVTEIRKFEFRKSMDRKRTSIHATTHVLGFYDRQSAQRERKAEHPSKALNNDNR